MTVWVGGMYSRKRTFGYPKSYGESNKAYAPYPALITRTGRKDID